MPLSTTQYGFIIDPMVPFTDASGTTIRNGYVRVFVAGSSTPVITYKNYDGATNEETIQLDNSGRTAYPVIVSKGNTYKVCVYDAEHSQESPILTIDKVVPAGANVEATNIVTGLDNVESPEAGWVKSTVSGTDAEVSLDATNVTSEVDTMVKATAASADYMMPLVHKTGSDPDKKITLGNIFKFVLNFIHSGHRHRGGPHQRQLLRARRKRRDEEAQLHDAPHEDCAERARRQRGAGFRPDPYKRKSVPCWRKLCLQWFVLRFQNNALRSLEC